jgi:hypothetical protein
MVALTLFAPAPRRMRSLSVGQLSAVRLLARCSALLRVPLVPC